MNEINTITRKQFNQNILEIYEKSKLIDNKWKIINTNVLDDHENLLINYLECIEQNLFENELLTLTIHIVYSSSFNVPVLYLNINKSNGSLLSYKETYEYFKIKFEQESGDDLILTQQEHPILFKPFYFIHPCKTSKWMSDSLIKDLNTINCEANYTLKWLSFVFSAFNLKLNLKYGMKLEQLKN